MRFVLDVMSLTVFNSIPVSQQEEAIPELEIDVDELLDMPSDVERAARVKVGHAHGRTETNSF